MNKIIRFYSFFRNCNIDLLLYKSNTPVFGGYYGIRQIDHDKKTVTDRKGYCLDAACNVFDEMRIEILKNTQ